MIGRSWISPVRQCIIPFVLLVLVGGRGLCCWLDAGCYWGSAAIGSILFFVGYVEYLPLLNKLFLDSLGLPTLMINGLAALINFYFTLDCVIVEFAIECDRCLSGGWLADDLKGDFIASY